MTLGKEKMKTLAILILITTAVLCGCTAIAGRPAVEVEITNQSSHDLANAQANFGDYACKWGIVGKTFSAIYLFYPHPITADTELHWDEAGSHRVEKIDLRQVYRRREAGRLTFSVLDSGVEVTFQKK